MKVVLRSQINSGHRFGVQGIIKWYKRLRRAGVEADKEFEALLDSNLIWIGNIR